jgi:putative ABC transport system permease protein
LETCPSIEIEVMNNIKHPLPPKWPASFLRLLYSTSLYEIIEGDLLEQYYRDIEVQGLQKARRKYILNCIGFLWPMFRLNNYSLSVNQGAAIGSYLNIAYRHFSRAKLLSLIHILGLSVAITTFTLITLYVSFEKSYDQSYRNERIYRVAFEQNKNGEQKRVSAKNLAGVPSLIKEHFPEVRACTAFDRTAIQAHFLFRYNGRRYFEQEPFYQTDSSFFKVFPSLLLQGDPATVLSDPHNLVISQKIAKKIFGEEDPIGKTIQNGSLSYSDVSDFVIAGVMRDLPANSHFHVNFIAVNSHNDELVKSNFWTGPKFYTYILLDELADPSTVSEKLNLLINEVSKDNAELDGSSVFLQRVSDIHLLSNLPDELEPTSSEKIVNGLWIIGLAIIAMAWINYVNIETARFTTRVKEVGVRRIVGSTKGDLAFQFLLEYTLLAIVSVVIAVLLIVLVAPSFYDQTGIRIDGIQWINSEIWQVALGLFIVGSLTAGAYPAAFLLKINPITHLHAGKSGRKSRTTLRRPFILVQFVAVLFLVSFLFVIYHQLSHIRLADKKISIDQVISIRNPSVYTNEDDSINFAEFQSLKQKLFQSPQINIATSASVIPGMPVDEYLINRLKIDPTAPYDPTRYMLLFVDYDFIPFYNIKLKSGRNYSIDNGDEQDWNKIILNESAAKALGYTKAATALDEEVYFHLWGKSFEKYKIVGIVEDYHQQSIKEKIQPLILTLNHSRFQQVFYSIKLDASSRPSEALAYIEKCWKEVFPDKPFDYFFQDVFYDQQFKTELMFEKLFIIFSGVSLFIACLGVFGMALFEANSRVKEISIRKVLGATVSSILGLLSREFLRLVLGASAIAIPLSYYGAHKWLLNYPSRIEISPTFFLLPLFGMVVLIALVSGVLTLRTARSNPIDYLKDE